MAEEWLVGKNSLLLLCCHWTLFLSLDTKSSLLVVERLQGSHKDKTWGHTNKISLLCVRNHAHFWAAMLTADTKNLKPTFPVNPLHQGLLSPNQRPARGWLLLGNHGNLSHTSLFLALGQSLQWPCRGSLLAFERMHEGRKDCWHYLVVLYQSKNKTGHWPVWFILYVLLPQTTSVLLVHPTFIQHSFFPGLVSAFSAIVLNFTCISSSTFISHAFWKKMSVFFLINFF